MLVAHLFLRLCFLVVPLPTRSTLFPYTTLFRALMPAGLGMAYTLDAPRLSEEQSAAEVRWQVELPFHQRLFTEPAGFSPEYRWHSGKLFWSREPESSAADLERWIGAGAGPNVT